jgi:hypothetical protein
MCDVKRAVDYLPQMNSEEDSPHHYFFRIGTEEKCLELFVSSLRAICTDRTTSEYALQGLRARGRCVYCVADTMLVSLHNGNYRDMMTLRKTYSTHFRDQMNKDFLRIVPWNLVPEM